MFHCRMQVKLSGTLLPFLSVPLPLQQLLKMALKPQLMEILTVFATYSLTFCNFLDIRFCLVSLVVMFPILRFVKADSKKCAPTEEGTTAAEDPEYSVVYNLTKQKLKNQSQIMSLRVKVQINSIVMRLKQEKKNRNETDDTKRARLQKIRDPTAQKRYKAKEMERLREKKKYLRKIYQKLMKNKGLRTEVEAESSPS